MAKTAEEILHSNINMSNMVENCEYTEKECIKSMLEFAAQEVEEYKERLREAVIEKFYPSSMEMSGQYAGMQLNKLIDTVK